MASEVPIIIGSDDEESDSDDVVLIKEEIEVEEDNDDVIFMSETKATPPPEPEHKDKPELALRSLSVPAPGSDNSPTLNRSISIASCAGRLSLDDGQDPGIQCDALPLLSNMVNTSGPLDLSSKSGDNLQPALCGGFNTDMTGGSVAQDSSVDSTSLSLAAVWQGGDGAVTLDTSISNCNNTVADAVKTSVCTDAGILPCAVSGSTDAGMTSSSIAMSVRTYTDITVLPGGIMADTALLPPLDNTVSAPSDLNTSKYYNFPMTNESRPFSIQEKAESSVSFSTNPSNSQVVLSSADAMDTSEPKKWDTKPPLCTDKQSEHQASCSGLDSEKSGNANPVTSIQSSVSCNSATESSTSPTVIVSKTSTQSVDSSKTNHDRSVNAPLVSGDVHTNTSLSSDSSQCTTSISAASLSVSAPSSVSASTSASGADSTSTAISLSPTSCATLFINQTSSNCDPFSASHFWISSLDQGGLTSTSCSDVKSHSASPAVITSPHMSLSVTSNADSTVTQSVNGASGLPGGSSYFLPGQQHSATNAISSTSDPLTQSQGLGGTSNMSFNVSDSNRLYNPLTHPIYMQNQQLKHSLSLSALSSRAKSSVKPLCKRQFSFPRTTPLPPKKQKRFNDGNSKCASCAVTLVGEKFSRCPNGHTACAKCLEEKVKLLLTGKAKESVRCLDRRCDSFYPVSELKLSLPSIVVEILEDKLDQEYVDYISDMMLRNASGDKEPGATTSGSSGSGDTATDRQRFQEYKNDGSFPEYWTAMDENTIQKKGYVCVELEADTPEYDEVVLQFFQSMVDQNVEVTSVHRVQNPIQWKYYCVKKSEIEQDNDGFALERQLFHGTSSNVVESICRRGFDWRVCGKHGTLYGQGSYFAANASYSHQYTDLKRPRHLASSMMLANPMSMTLPTTPSLIYPPININFGQPLNSLTFTALNLSHNATTQTSNTAATGSAFQPIPSSHVVQNNTSVIQNSGPIIQNNNSVIQNNNSSVIQSNSSVIQNSSSVIQNNSSVQSNLTLTQTPTHSGSQQNQVQSSSCSQRPTMRFKVGPNKHQAAIRSIIGHPSSSLLQGIGDSHENTRTSAKVFLAKVLVGKFVKGYPKLRKPPPLYPREDPFGKCFDSCVDEPRSPKIYVIFDSAQAYPEYLLEYTYSEVQGIHNL